MPTPPDDSLAPVLAAGIQALSLGLDESTQGRLLRYLKLIAQWNRVYNLTAVRDPAAMLTQHLLDCLAIVPAIRRHWDASNAGGRGEGEVLRILDVGSGAGLPGVVLALSEPSWHVTCVDTVGKKASFIRQVAAELGASNLEARHQRVEEMHGERFDLVTSRAFASLADFVSLTRERLEADACWAAMKAQLTAEETAALPAEIEVFHVEPLQVPGLNASRCLVWMRPAAQA
jgi:16S rRNA (guanine527-N7)-methyltransferase